MIFITNMSGDNLHGKQPLKFYSEELTITKIQLIEKHFKFTYLNDKMSNLDEKHNEWKDILAG